MDFPASETIFLVFKGAAAAAQGQIGAIIALFQRCPRLSELPAKFVVPDFHPFVF